MHKNILLCVGITILFLGTCIASSVAINNVKKSTIPICNGNTLYVGGTGSGNYTSIQDAIDDASDGDTVFVYDESSPYYENVCINKSINLIGEDRETTVIDGSGGDVVVYIETDWVNINGFTIQNSGGFGVGIILSNYNTISGNNISSHAYYGILIEYSSMNIIMDNIISDNRYGLFFHHSSGNNITGNYIISNRYFGISLYQLCNRTIISNNNNAVHHYSSGVNIIYNNYFDNVRNAEDDWYNIWNITKTLGTNIIGGKWLGGNYWSDYTGDDLNGDGIGDTKLPYKYGMKKGGDWLPLTNQPPGPTIINGSISGKPGRTYSYTFVAEDPNNNDVFYYIDWGDNNTELTDFNASGKDVTVKHKWSEVETYNITAKAEDIYGVEGPEGTLTVTIPRTKATTYQWYHWFLERFPMLERLLGLIRTG